ncbi:MAG: Sulfate adenylate transferase subunit 1 [Candidatus Tokpelaia sp. JSC189]|nr:MAG: Sulfate adenylate transferase subunit 1 [Candidatus Tokpelaia sp. JSC189]
MSAATDWSDHINTTSQIAHNNASLLRFITCGSVDDGKSTLIGRLLHDTGSIFQDQMESFQQDSKKFNVEDNDLNFALLVDGLSAEREQGITIDVAYRYFSTPKRLFIIADTPGHEQYIRNMATGASQADLAIILIDARKGVLPQTRRHSFITSMVGIRSIVVAINKMDMVNFDYNVFDRIVREYKSLLPKLDFREIKFIPLSAKLGVNVVNRTDHIPWYNGPTLFEYLETVEPANTDSSNGQFYFPVQWINRPNPDFRGFCGTVVSGSIRTGDMVRSLPSGKRSRIRQIYNPAGETGDTTAGEATILTLEDEIDTSRGDVLVSEDNPIVPSKTLRSQLLWMSSHPMITGKRYFIKLATSLVPVNIVRVEEKIDIHSYCSEPSRNLGPNEIGHVFLNLEKPLVAIPYSDSRVLGAFILIDPLTNETVALGIVRNAFSFSAVQYSVQKNGVLELSRLEKIWADDTHNLSKSRFVALRFITAMLLSILAIIFGVSFVGAFCIFIFDFLLRPFLKVLAAPSK